MPKTDFIIVGQGIAGTMLAWFLEKQNKSFIIVDKLNPSSSSQVAAGIIHPITGRRIVKTWMADTLIPFAEAAYREIEDSHSIKFFHQIPILELLDTVKEYNDWNTRSESPETKEYIQNSGTVANYDEFLKSHFRHISINHSGWVNLKVLLQHFRNQYLQKETLVEESFNHLHLKIDDGKVSYHTIEANKIIFCEGICAASENPFWKHLPFLPAKGEILTIRTRLPHRLKHIINKKIFILPIADDLIKVGSTYNWNELNYVPTEEAKEFLLKQLSQLIKVDFEIVNQEASIRPSVKNRRPFIGLHPQHAEVGILNGLGTKGCLLAPFFANHFAEFLCDKCSSLIDEVNVANHR